MKTNLEIGSPTGASPAKKKFKSVAQSLLTSQSLNCKYCGLKFGIVGAARKHELLCTRRFKDLLAQAAVPEYNSNEVVGPSHVQNVREQHNAPNEDPIVDDATLPSQEEAVPQPQPHSDPEIDFSYELARFMWLANQKRGLPDKDRETLIDLFVKGSELGIINCDLAFKNLPQFKVTAIYIY